MTDRLPLPSDDQLPDEVSEVLANLPPLNIFRMLGHAPASFRPFLELGGSILGDEDFDPRLREIAILRVATVTRAGYEWAQHVQLAGNVGVSTEEIEAVGADGPVTSLGDEAALVCRVADEVSREVRLSDEALGLAVERWGESGTTHLILCVGYYNMVSRFLESTRVPLEDDALLEGATPDDLAEGSGTARSS